MISIVPKLGLQSTHMHPPAILNKAPLASGFTAKTPVPLYWATYGAAHAERLLVLHGGPGADHGYLLPQMLELADRWQLTFYDQRGGGQSPDESRQPVTWQTHVEDLTALATELGLEPLTIVGYSWGALLAMLHALDAQRTGSSRAPARLVLIDPAPPNSAFRREMATEFAARQKSEPVERERSALQSSGLRETDPDAYRRRLFDLSVAGYFFDHERAREMTPFRVVGRIQDSVWKSLGDFDLLPGLASLSVPTLVVHGRDDPIPVQSSLSVADALKARFVLLENCGHVPYVEQPRALFSAIRSFLDDYHVQAPE